MTSAFFLEPTCSVTVDKLSKKKGFRKVNPVVANTQLTHTQEQQGEGFLTQISAFL